MGGFNFFLLLFFCGISAWAGNLLPNGDFNHGIAGYIIGDSGRFYMPSYKLIPGQDGNALVLTAKPNEIIALYLPEIKLEPSQEYEVSFQAKSSIDGFHLIVSEYCRVGNSVGSRGRFFPVVMRNWKTFSFRWHPSEKEDYGGFRLVSTGARLKAPVELYLANLRINPVGEPEKLAPELTASFQYDPLDRRIAPGQTVFIPVRLFNRGKRHSFKLNWQIVDRSNGKTVHRGALTGFAESGITEKRIAISVRRNGVFILRGEINGIPIIAPFRFAVVPSLRVRPGELPIDLGINSIATNAKRYIPSQEEFNFFADSGHVILRTWDNGNPFIWREIEPQDGEFFWDRTDIMTDRAERAGLEVFPVLGGMFFTYPDQKPFGPKEPGGHALPLWLYQKAQIVSCPPNMPQFTRKGRKTALPPLEDWERMVRSLADRYQGRIRCWEVMNEPNLCLTPEQYLPYLKSASAILREKGRNNTVVGFSATGDFNGHIMEFVDEMLRLGAGKECDAISFHPYNNLFEDSSRSGEATISAFRSFLKQNKQERLALWNSECYYLNPKSRGGADSDGSSYHAGYLIRRYLLDAAQGLRASILIPGSAMLDPAVNENFNRKRDSLFFRSRLLPGEKYIAATVFAILLKGTKYEGKLECPGRIRVYKFRGEKGVTAAFFGMHTASPEKRRLNFRHIPSSVRFLDYLGNQVKSETFAVSPIPTWITARTEEELNELFSSMTVFEQTARQP